MKVIVTGAAGMLGKDILKVFSTESDIDLYPIDKVPVNHKNAKAVDLTDKRAAEGMLSQIKPDAIVHCAAYTNVKWCEDPANHAATAKLHIGVTGDLASYKGSRFIYISTDSVFDGKTGNYSEDSKPEPITFYAKSKLKGEAAALKANSKALVIRTNIYGFHIPARPSSFLVDGALEKLIKGEHISGYDNVFVNFIYTKQLARIVGRLLKNEINGHLNVASKERISKYAFLVDMAKVFDIDAKLINKQPAPSSMNPGDTSLNISKLKKLLKEEPSIADGLKELHRDHEAAS